MLEMRVVSVADCSLGYGSPQIEALARSIARHYAPSRATLFETDQSDRPPRPAIFRDVDVIRVPTRFAPCTASGLIQYIIAVAEQIDRIKPHVLVCCSPLMLGVLARIRKRPPLTILSMLESLSHYERLACGLGQLATDLLRSAADEIDIILYSDEVAASTDVGRASLMGIPLAVLFNATCAADATTATKPADERQARVLFAGSPEGGLTLGEYCLRPEIQHLPIDLYGVLGSAAEVGRSGELESLSGAIRYCGYVDTERLARLRPSYAYSVVFWDSAPGQPPPASPNQFFESIASGVPPITAPHPQCEMIAERYQCGIVMRERSLSAFSDAIENALAIFGTSEYLGMVEGCRRAVEAELNWDKQFAKLRHWLPEEIDEQR